MALGGEVSGHFVQQGPNSWQLLRESANELTTAIANDDCGFVARYLECKPDVNALLTFLYWSADQSQFKASAVNVRRRTLLTIAAQLGSLSVVELLVHRGAVVDAKAPEDGVSALEVALWGDRNNATNAAIVELLQKASSPTSAASMRYSSTSEQDIGGDSLNQPLFATTRTELTRTESADDEFRMFFFKVAKCCKRHAHDWRACPFAHPTENARRRDPREFQYSSIACPDYKMGFCIRGDACGFAHGVFEGWLHPARYRTQLCKDGANCHRPICFFAHSLPELRTPTYVWTPSAEEMSTAGITEVPLSNAQQNQQDLESAQLVGLQSSRGMLASEAAAAWSSSTCQGSLLGSRSAVNGCEDDLGECCEDDSDEGSWHLYTRTRIVHRYKVAETSNEGKFFCPPPASVESNSYPGHSYPSSKVNHLMNHKALSDVQGALLSADSHSSPAVSGRTSHTSGGHPTAGQLNLEVSSQDQDRFYTALAQQQQQMDNYYVSMSQQQPQVAFGGEFSLSSIVPPPPPPPPPHPSTDSDPSMLGFTVPRMSNSFARRHGLNPKDNAMLNLQKLAIQNQMTEPAVSKDSSSHGNRSNRRQGQGKGTGVQRPAAGNSSGRRQLYQAPMVQDILAPLTQPAQSFYGYNGGQMLSSMHSGLGSNDASLAALNQSLMALNFQHQQSQMPSLSAFPDNMYNGGIGAQGYR